MVVPPAPPSITQSSELRDMWAHDIACEFLAGILDRWPGSLAARSHSEDVLSGTASRVVLLSFCSSHTERSSLRRS